jgi:serine/threonine-protein kinase
MAENVADVEEMVFDEELLFDEARREPSTRRDELVREGEVLAGKYRVERIPGRNGLGVLVQVRHVELGQEVTLKFLVPDACMYPEFVQRFIREARSAVKIQGEHVARVTDVGRLESGAPYMVREFLRGPDFAEVVKVRGALPVSEACDYIIQAAEAVAEAHAIGIAHRNLRPTTLVVTRRSDGSPLVKVFDFAAAEALHVEPFTKRSVSLVGSSALLASLPYLSPEQVRDPHGVDFRADVYALGAVLYELLSGVAPFEAESAPALLAMVAADTPVPLGNLRPDVPPELEQAVMRCLSKSRELRFASIADFATVLSAFASPDSTSSIEHILRLARRSTRLPPASVSDGRLATPTLPIASPPPSQETKSEPVLSAAAPTFQEAPAAVRAPAFAAARSMPPPLRRTSLPPPLEPKVAAAPAAEPAPSVPPPPHAPASTKTTIMPPSRRSSVSWGLSQSWAPEPARAPLPVRKLAMVGAAAALSAFLLVSFVRNSALSGHAAAAAQPVAAAQLTSTPALPAPPAPAPVVTEVASTSPAAPVAPPAAAVPAAPVPAVAPIATAAVAAVPAARPQVLVAARPVAAAPRLVAPHVAAPAVEDAPRSATPAKLAAAAPTKSKDLFSDPD